MPNPLHALHAAVEAEFQPYAEIEIVATFGQPQAEYAAVRTGAGLIDLAQRGLIELTGKDRLSFLNNLLTNQTWDKETKQGLAAGTGVYAFFLSTKGRIVCDVNVLELGERCLLEVDGRVAGAFVQSLQKYIFAEQVQITSCLNNLHQFALHGPEVPDLLSELFSFGGGTLADGELGPAVPLLPLASVQLQLDQIPITVWRDDVAAVPGFNLIVPAEHAEKIWRLLLDTFAQAQTHQPAKLRLRPFGWAVYNTTRIEAGRPFFGIDFDETHLPAETGQMSRAVSLTKGCYLGQEIVARMHARNQVARQIVGIRMKEDALPMAGSPIFDSAGNTIGGITSSTVSPILSNACIALALIKKTFAEIGTEIKIPAEGAIRAARVAATPFLTS